MSASGAAGKSAADARLQAGVGPLDTVFQFALVASMFAIAILAELAGAAWPLQLAIAAAGVAAGCAVFRMRRIGQQLAAARDHSESADRLEVERLADHVWELQEADQRFRGLVDALGDIVVHRDREGRIVQSNRVLASLLGMEADDLAGKTLADLGIEIGVVPDAAFNEGECLSSTDVAIKTPNGTRWFSWIELSVRDKQSEAVSHRAIARDITDRKRAELSAIRARERAEHASQAKSRFLATVSHEIRTPMNGIMGMAKLLGGTRLSPEQTTYVGAISTSASALLALIEDLLDFSKIEAGRLELEPQKCSPRELVEHTVELMAARAYAKDIGLGCYVDPCVPAAAQLDPGRFRQVLLNLVGNAIKFTDIGGVQVDVSCSEEGGTRKLVIAVKDSGPGLDKADLKRIFEEFEQVDDSRTRKHGGAGLGLAISARIVEAMKGRIDVTGSPGKGATFTLTLPLEDAAPPAVRQDTALEGRRAIVVSGSVMEADAIARTIRAYGGEAEVAPSADAAAALGGEGEFDTVLVDSALEAPDCTLLKRLHGVGLSRAQAVTLIKPTDRGRLAELRGGGYSTFLPRPVRGETLLRMLLPGSGEKIAGRRADLTRSRKSRAAKGITVLIAEDNEINALLARSALTKSGHSVDVVTNGRAALTALTEPSKHYDVVLMDLHMPVMDGLDAITGLRRHEAESGIPPVPVLVLSADGQEHTRQSVLTHGANGFLSKPLDPAALVAAVEEHATA
ncbi:MAG: response regulator [Rhizobiaceae bacterium]|nr:response regulator [Rhizobiaceae bacterium]